MIRIRSRFAWFGLLGALLLATPARADAPISGADKQYDDFDYLDQEIRDRFTKLRWRRKTTGGRVSLATAKGQCAAPFRLPTVKELLTIVDEDGPSNREYDQKKLAEVNKYIDDDAFPETPTDASFWSSSVNPDDPGRVYTVNFGTGQANDDDATSTFYVRCVTYDP